MSDLPSMLSIVPLRNCENEMCGACPACLADHDPAETVLASRVVALEAELSASRADHRVALAGLQRALADERLNAQSADREANNLRHDLAVARREAGQSRERALELDTELVRARESMRSLDIAVTEADAALRVAGVPVAVSVHGQERPLTLAERVKTLALRMVRAELEVGDLKARAHAARLVGVDGQALIPEGRS